MNTTDLMPPRNLRDWQRAKLADLRDRTFPFSRHGDKVTVVAYSFPEDVDSEAFDFLKCSLLQTWSVLGKLPTVVVSHRHFTALDEFAKKHDVVDIQIEPSLVPGVIDSMSADCCARLHSRFSTPYCLIVQDDGFPFLDDLDEFLGFYDFVGAPYVRISWWRNLICHALGWWMSNGGFSLRSKRICEASALHWNRKYARRHPCAATVEDRFYTQTLPLWHTSYRHAFRIAPNTKSIRFSYDAIVRQPLKRLPMGFHRASTFSELGKRGLFNNPSVS